MWIYIIIGLVILIFIYFLIVNNKLIKLNNMVTEAFSTMDVYLKKRWDLIPNLVEVVKGYTSHEKETFETITQLRNGIYDNMSNNEKVNINTKLTQSLNKIIALVESYPELKASNNYQELSKSLTKVEEDIANARKYYNGTVRIYNNKVEMVPSNIVASILGYKSAKMFEIESNERKSVKVEL